MALSGKVMPSPDWQAGSAGFGAGMGGAVAERMGWGAEMAAAGGVGRRGIAGFWGGGAPVEEISEEAHDW